MSPNLGVAWWWTYLITPEQLVVVRDHEIPLPRTRDLEVRADGLWAQMVCETPMEHWSIGLEAFGVALSDPMDGLRGEWGERVAVGLDIEWEECGFASAATSPTSYRQPGMVHGELLVGTARIPFEGVGGREHSWGVSRWEGRDDFGLAFQVTDQLAGSILPGDEGRIRRGLVSRKGSPAESVAAAATEALWTPPGAPMLGTLSLAGVDLQAQSLAWVAIPVPGPGTATSSVARALVRVSSPEGEGSGWAEWFTSGEEVAPSRS